MFGALNTAVIDIHAQPEDVWRVLIDRALWIEGFVGKTLIDGPENAVGERAKFTTRTPDSVMATRIEEILVRDPPCRLVARLALEDNDATFAFAEWRLARIAERSNLEMNLYWTDLPDAGADWPAIRVQRQGYLDHTQAALDTIVSRIADAVNQRSEAR